MRLEQKVGRVTGAGRGIGRAIALAYAREGAGVLVKYAHSEEDAGAVVQEILHAGGRGIAVHADIGNVDQHDGLIDAALQKFGRLDILVNTAGIEVHERVLEPKLVTWELTIGV